MSAPAEIHEQMERRSFLGLLLAAIGGVAGAVMAVPLVRFATFPLRSRSAQATWSDVGKIDEFQSLNAPAARTIDIQTIEGWRTSVMQNNVYVVPNGSGSLKVLSSVCPHLGCAVRWVEDKDRFICPCHGGTFTKTGELVSGPPLRAMDELESKVENGMLRVRFEYFRQLDANKESVS
ncbi:MAG TPA: Rieske (2Fe-2S) protein [Acidobacteriaceae bacterium]|nr:Rieske (2Fe-2S) protein [Acidobacteriaceae bacterium]